jgi:phage gp36-like protein
MSYATYQNYLDEFGTDDIPGDGESRIPRAIEKASRLADSYIRAGGLPTPLVDELAIGDIRGHVMDIARYYAWSDNPGDELRKRYEDATRWFEGLASGRNRLQTSEQSSVKPGFHNVRIIRS